MKQSFSHMRDEGEEWAQKAQVLRNELDSVVAEWPPKTKRSKSKEPEVSTCAPPSSANGTETKSTEVQTELACTATSSTSSEANAPVSSTDQGMPGKDARSVAILSTFLSVLSYGISTDAIAAHLVNMQEGIDVDSVEKLLSRYPECFVKENKKEGQTLWRLVALKPVIQ